MYAGQASILWRRVIAHVEEGRKYWDAVFFKEVHSGLNAHEMVAIHAFDPPWNRQTPKLKHMRGIASILKSWGPEIERRFNLHHSLT